MTIAILVLYFAVLLGIGAFAQRLFRGTGQDFFAASRSLGPFVLLMAIFGTHMTAFSILGASAEAYKRGIGVFSLMASSSAIVVPLLLLFVAPKVWALGRDFGFTTQAQYFRARFASDRLGLLLFAVLTLLLLPYLLVSVMGGGITFAKISGGALSPAAGSAILCAVVLTYVSTGGMRGTAWANTFQALMFTSLGAVALFTIAGDWGGLAEAFGALGAQKPELLGRQDAIAPAELATYTLIPLSAGMFPHLFMQWLAAEKPGHFRVSSTFYPLCLVLVWLPSIALGALAHLDFPGLKGPAVAGVFLELIDRHFGDLMVGLITAGVLAAVMSLDSQVLAASNMFTNDLVRHYGYHDRLSEKQLVLLGRAFVIGIVALCWVASLFLKPTLFAIAVWSFTGFAGLLPILLAALFWRRATAAGAAASTLTVLGLLGFYLSQGASPERGLPALGGVLPLTVVLAASAAALVVVSLVTRPPEQAVVERFFR
jgi:SSS family solute:Na+ symporter